MRKTHDILVETRAALPALTASKERKNAALEAIASRLVSEQEEILAANRADVEAAKDRYGDVMIDRLTLTPERIAGMAQGVREVAELPDPETLYRKYPHELSVCCGAWKDPTGSSLRRPPCPSALWRSFTRAVRT